MRISNITMAAAAAILASVAFHRLGARGADGDHVRSPGAMRPTANTARAKRPGQPTRSQTYEAQGYASEKLDSGDGTFSMEEIKGTGHRFFGKVSVGFAKVVEHAFSRSGRPNGYILGEEAGGAFVAGLRYGEGVLYTKDAGEHRVYLAGAVHRLRLWRRGLQDHGAGL